MDPVVWHRDRAERLFGFHYGIEIYVPKPKRVHGYYVMPFMLDGELVGRADVKADSKGKKLLVQSAFVEDGHDHDRVAGAMASELEQFAGWLELDDVSVMSKGNVVGSLRKRL